MWSGLQPIVLPRCGEQIAPTPATGPLTMTGAFPSEIDSTGDATFTGKVTVTATARPVTGVASPEADVYVARSGTVVATPLVKDLIGVPVRLSPGSSQEFAARGTIRPCSEGGGPADAAPGRTLPAGRYDVFAVVAVIDDAGSSVVATGGPWPLDVT